MLTFAKRDIENGDFNYGERIMLGRIFANVETSDIERTKQIIKCLHDRDMTDREAEDQIEYALYICRSFVAWQEREARECYIPPQREAIEAGVEQMAKEIGDMGGVVDLAERFGFTFEQVYKMPYLDVFTIWKVDAAKTKFQRRLNKVLERQHKAK